MSGAPTLYGSSSSGNCLKPKWVAQLLGLPFDWVEIDSFTRMAHLGGFDLGPFAALRAWVARVETGLGLGCGTT